MTYYKWKVTIWVQNDDSLSIIQKSLGKYSFKNGICIGLEENKEEASE